MSATSRRDLVTGCGNSVRMLRILSKTRQKGRAAGPTCLAAAGSVCFARVKLCKTATVKQRMAATNSGSSNWENDVGANGEPVELLARER
jgi:hypothetical protein